MISNPSPTLLFSSYVVTSHGELLALRTNQEKIACNVFVSRKQQRLVVNLEIAFQLNLATCWIIVPDYEGLKRRFTDLNGREGGNDVEGPLDWSSAGTSISGEHNDSVIAHSSDTGSDTESDEEEIFENSYLNWDIADWDLQGFDAPN